MTGAELYSTIQEKADVSYSGELDPTFANRLILEATINIVQNIYRTRLTNQNSFDELTYLVATNKTYSVNPVTNSLHLGDFMRTINGIGVVGQTVIINTELPHDLETGERVSFRDIVGTINLHNLNAGVYTITVISANQFSIVVTTFVPLGGAVNFGRVIFPDSIPDYFHYLVGEARFTSLTEYTVTGSTDTTPIKITLNKRTSFRDKDQVVIAGITGNTAANGTFYLRQANEFDYFLYSDKKLKVPVAGNGVHAGTGTISKIYNSNLVFKMSDEKGSIYGKSTVKNPHFQQSKTLMRILPADEPCSQITIDYIRTLPFAIDVNDSTNDLTNYYPLPFQYLIIAETCNLFAQSTRDVNLYQTSALEIKENP